jgi:hypothetical protein
MKSFHPAEGGRIKKEKTKGIDFPRLPAHAINAFSCSPAPGNFLSRNQTGRGVLFLGTSKNKFFRGLLTLDSRSAAVRPPFENNLPRRTFDSKPQVRGVVDSK